MEIALLLFSKLLPLYVLILLGFLVGKFLHAKKETVATLLIYAIVPVIVFHGAYSTTITFGMLALPVIFFGISVCISVTLYFVSSRIWKDSTKNILAFGSAAGNAGYFGLPVAIAIFGEQVLGIAVLCILGVILFENTVGYYLMARGNFTVNQSVRKLLSLPALYAFFIGIVMNVSGIELGKTYADFVALDRGAYTVLGMMLIGLGLSHLEEASRFDLAYILVLFFSKFILWPAGIALVIFADVYLFRLFTTEIHRVMLLLSIVPVAANTVAFATQLRIQPHKAAVGVFLSTLFALFYIPLFISLWI